MRQHCSDTIVQQSPLEGHNYIGQQSPLEGHNYIGQQSPLEANAGEMPRRSALALEVECVEQGGSLALATLSGNWAFPASEHRFSNATCDLIRLMLDNNAATRPSVAEVLDRLDRLERQPSRDHAISIS